MKRESFCIKLKPGMKEEYKRRHDNIWPEMTKMLKDTGVENYSIWLYGEELLFGYRELDEEKAGKGLTPEQIELDKKWQEYMSDIITHIVNPETGDIKGLELMFLHE